MKKTSFFTNLAVFLAMIFVGSVVYAKDTIKIGTTYGMTGRIGWIGVDCVDGAKMIVDETNAKGGINGKKLELVIYDSKNEPDVARTNFEKLIKKDKVVGILGPTVTQEVLTVMPIAQKYKIVYISTSGGTPINDRILPDYKKRGEKAYYWAISPGTPIQNRKKLLWLKEKGYKNFGNIEPLDEMGDISAKAFERFCKEFGMNLVASERIDDKGTDYTTQIYKIKAASADCIGSMASGSPAVTVKKNMDQAGMKNVPFMTSDANLSKKFIELLGEHTANVYNASTKPDVAIYLKDSDPLKKIILDFQKKFKEKYNKEPRGWGFACQGYDSASMLIRAIQAVGTNGEKMRDWIENQTRFEGVNAVYSWNDLDHRGIKLDQMLVFVIKGDAWVPAD